MGMTGSSIDTSALQSGITSGGGADQNAFATMRRQFYQSRGGKSGADAALKDSSHLQALKDLKASNQPYYHANNVTLFDHIAGTAPPPRQGEMFQVGEWMEGMAHVLPAEMKQEHG